MAPWGTRPFLCQAMGLLEGRDSITSPGPVSPGASGSGMSDTELGKRGDRAGAGGKAGRARPLGQLRSCRAC